MNSIHVGKNCLFKTINEALKNIDPNTVIFLDDEIYHEKIVIDIPNIVIDGQNKAKIIYNDYATKIHEDGREYVTFRTYTMLVKSPHVTLKNLTIENNAGEGYKVGQAVALHLYNDDIHVENCTLLAKQDTLFCGPFSPDLIERYIDLLPKDERIHEGEFHQYFENCTIKGTVDFIFGGASAIFLNCTIISLPTKNKSWIAAPDHDKENIHGFIFKSCKILKDKNTKDGTVFLARPWREYGLVKFIDCFLDSHINEKGFDIWDNTDRHINCRFFEKNSSGPGKNDSKRIEWSHINEGE